MGIYLEIGNSDRTLFSFGCFKEWDRYIGILGRVGIIVNLGRTLSLKIGFERLGKYILLIEGGSYCIQLGIQRQICFTSGNKSNILVQCFIFVYCAKLFRFCSNVSWIYDARTISQQTNRERSSSIQLRETIKIMDARNLLQR